MPRNPNWTHEELILALDLYFKLDPFPSHANHPEVIELSKFLNKLPLHENEKKDGVFRNPTGVYMKLCNFLRFDPNYSGVGLTAGSKKDEEIWNQFSQDRKHLRETASALRSFFDLPNEKNISEPESVYDDEFLEGKLLTHIHITRERNSKLVSKKKALVLQETGALVCEVCGFDFFEAYKDLGYGFAECHHKIPVSQLDNSKPTRLSDLAILCSNCHSMIHKSRPMLTIEELKEIITKPS